MPSFEAIRDPGQLDRSLANGVRTGTWTSNKTAAAAFQRWRPFLRPAAAEVQLTAVAHSGSAGISAVARTGIGAISAGATSR